MSVVAGVSTGSITGICPYCRTSYGESAGEDRGTEGSRESLPVDSGGSPQHPMLWLVCILSSIYFEFEILFLYYDMRRYFSCELCTYLGVI